MRRATADSIDLAIQGSPAKMVYNTAVVAIDPEQCILTLNNGSVVTADVVIGKHILTAATCI